MDSRARCRAVFGQHPFLEDGSQGTDAGAALASVVIDEREESIDGRQASDDGVLGRRSRAAER